MEPLQKDHNNMEEQYLAECKKNQSVNRCSSKAKLLSTVWLSQNLLLFCSYLIYCNFALKRSIAVENRECVLWSVPTAAAYPN